MQFDSDSDSDGSHISSTPPRQPNPPPPPSPKPPLPVSNKKSKINTKPKPSKSNKLPSKPPETLPQQDPDPDPFPLASFSSLPFHIRQRTSEAASTSSSHSIETLPAGFFSKSISFSKIRKPLLNLEASENEPVVNSPKAVVKSAKKHPNLIGASAPTPIVKVLRGAGEGNFVKLNLNGKRKKFLNKGWNKKGKFGSGKRYRNGYSSYSGSRSKRKKLEAEGGDNEEDGLDEENAKQQEKRKGWENECKVLEEAVLAARNEASDENLVKLLKLIHGYDSFREGQLEAIQNVLAGKSTMLILPTGAGKSLCYQLSALILPGITLVVSPLIALMIDQLRQLPPLISGALLSSSQTLEESSETLSQVRQGTIKVLFVSPERFLNEEFLSVISAVSSVSLVVIDEAHCISEWSHNFRPSFMRLRASLLHKSLNVGSVLAMTATATTTTLDAIMSALDIPYTNLIQNAHLRDNLRLMKDLLVLIKSSPFTEVKSIIVYCKFQSDTDQISRYLNDNNIKAKSYHSGISAKERGYVQELFGSNKIRVVVATVAFGMGLDKRDVGAVIHYSLPESLEEYVQEIGRAGRDGRLSYCHLFYDDEMYFKLRSLMYSEGVDEYAVNKFMSEVFPADKSSCGKICSLIKESAARRFDMKEETPAVSLAQKVSAIAVILK
ncbi:ATP-dependent DNA helicase q-like 5-like protein, partial [Trifolium pratense]